MRHGNAVSKLSRSPEKRARLLKALTTSLLIHERILTTHPRALALRSHFERLITRAPDHRRYVNPPGWEKFPEVVKRFEERPGGYTRILKAGRRVGDCSKISLIELVGNPFEIKSAFEKFKQTAPELTTRQYPAQIKPSNRPLLK